MCDAYEKYRIEAIYDDDQRVVATSYGIPFADVKWRIGHAIENGAKTVTVMVL